MPKMRETELGYCGWKGKVRKFHSGQDSPRTKSVCCGRFVIFNSEPAEVVISRDWLADVQRGRDVNKESFSKLHYGVI